MLQSVKNKNKKPNISLCLLLEPKVDTEIIYYFKLVSSNVSLFDTNKHIKIKINTKTKD